MPRDKQYDPEPTRQDALEAMKRLRKQYNLPDEDEHEGGGAVDEHSPGGADAYGNRSQDFRLASARRRRRSRNEGIA